MALRGGAPPPGALVVVGAAGAHGRGRGARLAKSDAARWRGRPSVAVLGFKRLSGQADVAWFSTAIGDTCSAPSAWRPPRRSGVIPGEDAWPARQLELHLADADSYGGKKALGALRDDLGSDYVVVGSYLAQAGGEVLVNLRLQDTKSGEIVLALSPRPAAQRDLGALVRTVGGRLVVKLGVPEGTGVAGDPWLPRDPRAARLYAEGVQKHRAFHDDGGARDLLEQAEAIEPDHLLIHAALADCLLDPRLGSARRRRGQVLAFEHAGALPREQRLHIEGRYRINSHDRERAVVIFRELTANSPDDWDYAEGSVDALALDDKFDEALAGAAEIRQHSAILAADPRLDFKECDLEDEHGDLPANARRMHGSRGRLKARARGARIVVANALFKRGSRRRLSGRADEAMVTRDLDEALAIFTSAGHRAGEEEVLNVEGNPEQRPR